MSTIVMTFRNRAEIDMMDIETMLRAKNEGRKISISIIGKTDYDEAILFIDISDRAEPRLFQSGEAANEVL